MRVSTVCEFIGGPLDGETRTKTTPGTLPEFKNGDGGTLRRQDGERVVAGLSRTHVGCYRRVDLRRRRAPAADVITYRWMD